MYFICGQKGSLINLEEDSRVTSLALDKQLLTQSGSSNHALLNTISALVIKKKCPNLSQSAFSNFVPYVIKGVSKNIVYLSVRLAGFNDEVFADARVYLTIDKTQKSSTRESLQSRPSFALSMVLSLRLLLSSDSNFSILSACLS